MSLDVYLTDQASETVFEANITHNLGQMAGEAGIYECMWRPEEIGVKKASQLVEPLRAGLIALVTEPERFEKLNPENGWGDYDGLVRFVIGYLRACRENPDAAVRACR